MAFILIINWYLSGLIRNPGNRLELLELQELLGTPQQSVGGTQQGTPGTPWNSRLELQELLRLLSEELRFNV